MEYRKIKGLNIDQTGKVFLKGRQLYPDKTGLFPAESIGFSFVTSEEILELWNNDPVVADSIDRQIQHANICTVSPNGTRDITPLVEWREKCDELKSGKSKDEIAKLELY